MVSTIRHLFTFNKKAHTQKSTANSRQSSLSPTASLASLSTESSLSRPQTPTSPQQAFFSTPQDIRGIFRTLESYWSFYHPQQQDWIAFDFDQSDLLERHYHQRQVSFQLPSCPGTSTGCTIHFQRPSIQQQQQQQNGELHLVLDHDLVRTMVPVWWYEQDLPDGSKGMCRFEHKNQVRLEALSEDRTQLSLTDEGFEGATMTVVTTPPQQHEEEEMRGLLYVYLPLSLPSMDQKLDRFDHATAEDALSTRRGSV
jgi:hypothetical protein